MRSKDPTFVYLVLSVGWPLFFSMLAVTNLVYEVEVAHLDPLRLLLVGSVLELARTMKVPKPQESSQEGRSRPKPTVDLTTNSEVVLSLVPDPSAKLEPQVEVDPPIAAGMRLTKEVWTR